MDGPNKIGEWQKISDLGSGAFGVVTLWKNNTSNDCIAIKKCKFQSVGSLSEKQKERWNNEVQIMKIINHPNVIKYKAIPPELEAGLNRHNPTKLPLLPMEYCLKGNLRRVLLKPQNLSGLQEEEVRCVLEDIGSGLQHLHNLKITHRDIKPDNIVLQNCDSRKGNTIYKIIDLGYAKELNDTIVSFVGTLHYLAPEIFQTEQYNSSVDYWSLGILTFEVICGVLPFLPQLSPFERFDKIKEKGPDDICIYLSYSGKITYSSEIKKENYISVCLKQNIEIWLRQVLQFDSSKRSEPFPNNMKVFEYLKDVLKKNIVRVFSVHKLEFYSYEINESTLVGTLKDWVSRDIKVSKENLILLFNKNTVMVDDSCLVNNILKTANNVFVVKKGSLVSDSIVYNFPKLLKELFKNPKKFDTMYLKPLYAQSIYYITVEKMIIQFFKESFYLYRAYVKNLIEYVKKSYRNTCQNVLKLLTKIECYNSIRKNNVCDIDLSDNQACKGCLTYHQRLLASLERSMGSLKDLQKKILVIMKRQHLLNNHLPNIEELIKNCDVEEQYKSATTLLEKYTSTNKKNGINIVMDIKNIVSNTIKIKDKFFNNELIKPYFSAMANVHNSTENVKLWLEGFDNHIADLAKCLEQNEVFYRDIILKAAENSHKTGEIKVVEDETESVANLNGELLNLPTSYLIMENQTLRLKFEEILSKSILEHKNYAESVRANII